MTSKILVADDSITIQKIVAMAFEHEDTVVEGIGNGKEAFSRLSEFQPDIVLADVDMPGINGFELSKKIKESPKFGSIPVLLLASDFEVFNNDLFLDSRADDHITKPFKSEEIIKMVKSRLQGVTQTSEDWGGASFFEEEDAGPIEDAIFPLSEEDLIPDAPDSGSTDEEEESLFVLSEDHFDKDIEKIDTDTVFNLTEHHLSEEPDQPTEIETSVHELSGNLQEEEIFEVAERVQEASLDTQDPGQDHNIVDRGAVERPSATDNDETYNQLMSLVDGLTRESKETAPSPAAKEILPADEMPGTTKIIDNVIQTVGAKKKETLAEMGGAVAPAEKEGAGDKQAPLSRPTGEKNPVSPAADSKDTGAVRSEGLSSTFFPAVKSKNKSTAAGQESSDLLRTGKPSAQKESLEGSDVSSRKKELEEIAQSLNLELSAPENEPGQPGSELESSLESAIEKEMAGLSKAILSTIREVVREVASDVIRQAVQDEVAKIRNKGEDS